jgi:teichuronic acid biosynthesis glycosyltransferase TuaG
MNLVSIIMPYFRKRDYIKKSINSALNQSYENFEIIIIYDDQKSHDIKYIEEISKLDYRINIIYNNKNIGAGLSRNVGIEHAKGDYLAFLDCDDLWDKNKLKLQINFMKEKNADFSFTAYDLINKKNKKISTMFAKPILKFDDLVMSCDIGLSTVIFKKKIYNSFCKFPNLKTKEDYVLWLKIAKKNKVLYGLNKPLTRWRVTPGSLSSNNIQKIIDAFTVYKKYLKYSVINSLFHVILLSINYLFKRL